MLFLLLSGIGILAYPFVSDALNNYLDQQIISHYQQQAVKEILATPQQDGGQWDMIVSLFQKYGVVPKSVMPESANSSN
ncbi:C1 family peptidase, partial [Enterococcus gallinarum]|uniref:C1 family peptidase n=1 Tax=Enterococcus gallinarum TaxID=1353 RepID=UPI003BE5A9D1